MDEIKDIDLGDGVTFEVKEVSNIMDEMEYPGIRFTMNAMMGKLVTPMKIDISTGDVITPRAIKYKYKLLLDDRSISLWSYNLETILAEKLQTVLARGLLNTRMRDFYDIKTLLSIYEQDIDIDVLKKRKHLKLWLPSVMTRSYIHSGSLIRRNIRMRLVSAMRISWRAQCSYGIKFNNW